MKTKVFTIFIICLFVLPCCATANSGDFSVDIELYLALHPVTLQASQQNFGSGLPAGLSFGAPQFTISQSGSGNGVLALAGNTSGSATFTAPAVAGTATNPVLSSNSLTLASGDVLGWNTAGTDTGISRDSAGVIDFGNGAAGDKSATLNAASLSLSNAVTSVGGIATSGSPGISLSVAPVSLTAQTAAIGTTTLYTVPGTGATFSMYRLFACVILTTAGSVSETIGPLVITYNDGTGARSINIGIGAVSPSTGVGSSTALTGAAGTYFCGILPFVAQGGTNIQYAIAYAANAANSAQYSLYIRLDTF